MTLRVEPVPQPVAPATTDSDGNFAVELPPVSDGTLINLLAPGDLGHWPALTKTVAPGS